MRSLQHLNGDDYERAAVNSSKTTRIGRKIRKDSEFSGERGIEK